MTQGSRNTAAGIALGATVLVHAGIAWWLLGLRDASPSRDATMALAVVWIERPPPAVAPPVLPLPRQARPDSAPAVPFRATRHRLQAVELEVPATGADASLPTAATLLEQAGEWARRQAPAADFAHDPLRHRPPPGAGGRFAMRRQVSPEDIVKGIGKLLGGGGYTEDPCPQIRRNLASLGTGGDAELTREEVDRLQRFCL